MLLPRGRYFKSLLKIEKIKKIEVLVFEKMVVIYLNFVF
jgi:hypothetical protein